MINYSHAFIVAAIVLLIILYNLMPEIKERRQQKKRTRARQAYQEDMQAQRLRQKALREYDDQRRKMVKM